MKDDFPDVESHEKDGKGNQQLVKHHAGKDFSNPGKHWDVNVKMTSIYRLCFKTAFSNIASFSNGKK